MKFLDLQISGYDFGGSRHNLPEMMKIRKFGKPVSPDREFDYELKAQRIIQNGVVDLDI